MQKWMVEFLRRFENSGIKIAGVNSILITKSNDLLLLTLSLSVLVVRCDVDLLHLYREVYDKV